jgi:tetratricopeptide (TPR) repeat protein
MLSSVNEILNHAISAQQNNNFLDAEKLYIKALNADPNNYGALINFGVLLKTLNRLDEAKKSFVKAIKINPKIELGYLNLGNIFFKLNKLDEAETNYKKTIEIKPNYAEAHFNLGIIYDNTDRSDQAELSYNEAIKLKPNYSQAYNNLGNLYRKLKRSNESEINYKKLIEINSSSADGYYNLANLYNDLDKFDDALLNYTKAIELNPNFVLCYNYLGSIYHKLNKLDDAISNYKKAIELNPDYSEVYFNLGISLFASNKAEEALENYKKAIELKPDYFEAYNNLGSVSQILGKLEEAEKHFKKAIELKPNYIEAHFNLSNIKTYKDEDDQFNQMKNLTLNKDLNKKQLYQLNFALAKAYEDLGNYEESFINYTKGNKLCKKVIGYNIEEDQNLFKQLEKSYLDIKKYSSRFSDLSDNPNPIFILGMPRSGTTLIEQIISSHSNVFGAGELDFIESFGDKLVRGIDETNYDSLLIFKNKYIQRLKEFTDKNSMVSDKMPLNFRYIGLILTVFPNAKIIHSIRDPAATCWGNYQQNFTEKRLIRYCYDLKDIVIYYNLYENLMNFWIKEFGNQIYNLNYETLTIDQEGETKKLINYLGLQWEDDCLNPEKNQRSVKTASSKQVRQKVYKGSSQKWKKFEPFLEGKLDNIIN